MKSNLKQMKAALNQHNAAKLADRANSLACRVYADAHQDAGDDATAELWRKVADFLDVWHENGRPFWNYENLSYDEQQPKHAVDRKTLIALDNGSSGAFLLEKATGWVWSIKGYGKKNRMVMHIDRLIEIYREATEQNVLKMRSVH